MKYRAGDRVRVTAWGDFPKYVGLDGTVRAVTNQGVVTVDLDHDPMSWNVTIHRMGLVFDPAFATDKLEKLNG